MARDADRERDELIRSISRLSEDMFTASWPGWCDEWMELDLTLGQLKILFLLYGQPLSNMSALAAGLGVSLPSCTSLVDHLVKAGMVERREDPADRRLVLGELSDTGRRLVAELWRSGQIQSEDLLQRMTVEELRVVDNAMTIFQRALAVVEPPAAAPRKQSGGSP